MNRFLTCTHSILGFLGSGMLTVAQAQLIRVADQQLTHSGSDAFGYDVALDGDRIVTGEFGRAFVYERGPQGWSEIAELTPSGTANGYYGNAVTIAGDLAFVGSPRDGDGLVYVFERNGSQWLETDVLSVDDGSPAGFDDQFGVTLGFDKGSGRLVVGAVYDDSAVMDGGAIYIFELIGGAWTQVHRILGLSAASYAAIGGEFDLEGDRIVLAEAYGSGVPMQAHVYELVGGQWNWQQTLSPLHPEGGTWSQPVGFGVSLDLSGNTIVAGVPSAGVLVARGGALVFEEGPGGWSQVDFLIPAMGVGNTAVGTGVAVHGDRIVLGDAGTANASLFARVGPGSWEERMLLSPTGVGDHGGFGENMAFDGRTVVSASWRASGPAGADYGAVYIHESIQGDVFGTLTCPGDRVVDLCPCGWNSSRYGGPGCWHSQIRGALLMGHGSPSLSGPGLAMTGFHLIPNAPCVIFSGSSTTASPLVFGNGLLCVAPPLRRHAVKPTGPAGGVFFGPLDNLLVGASPGQTRTYQIWYRDPLSHCGGGFNLSNGFSLQVTP